MDFLVLALSLVGLTAGAELLVRGASVLALRMGVSALFVGLTIVGFGTSAPELGASLYATLHGSSDVSVGNVVGSCLFNIGVILGLTALLKPVRVQLAAMRRELYIAIVAAIAPLLALTSGGVLPRWSGVVLFAGLIAFLVTSYRAARASSAQDEALATGELRSTFDDAPAKRRARDTAWFNVLLVLAGLALLVVGSQFFVRASISIAQALGVSELVIGLTVVSAGTSMPELVTSIVAARRGNPDIAIGNVIGSNIFNVLGILGICAMVAPQRVHPAMLRLDIPLLVVASIVLLPMVKSGGRISRREGAMLLAGYGAYLAVLLLRDA